MSDLEKFVRACQDAEIQQLEIADLRSRLKTLEDENARMREAYDKLEDDRDDLCARLETYEGRK